MSWQKCKFLRLLLYPQYMELNVVTNGVNFTSIKSKIDEIKYRSCQEFMTDISWMERDSLIAGKFLLFHLFIAR